MSAENSKIVYGGSLMVFLGTEPLAFSTSASLSMTMDTREISSKDSGTHKEFKGTKFGWDASTDGLMAYKLAGDTNGLDTLYDLYTSGETIGFAFAVASGTTPSYVKDTTVGNFTGNVLITSMSLTSPDLDNATYSISMLGTGDLTLVAGTA